MMEFECISPRLYRLDEQGMVLLWLIVGDKKALLIDTGFGFTPLKQAVEQVTNLPVVAVNTHVHVDHAAGNGQFDTVYGHPGDYYLIKRYYRHNAESRAFAISLMGHEELFADWRFTQAARSLPIGDGIIFDLGGQTIEVIELPGHSAGSLAFYWREQQILFSGDSIVASGVWLQVDTALPLCCYRQSLQRLLEKELPITKILPSHAYRGDGVSPEIIRQLLDLTEQILAGTAQSRPLVISDLPGILAKYEQAKIICSPHLLR